MISLETVRVVASALHEVKQGVNYSRRLGAVCPVCGTPRAKTIRSMPWADGVKIRYHRCANPGCLVFALQLTFKSIDIEE